MTVIKFKISNKLTRLRKVVQTKVADILKVAFWILREVAINKYCTKVFKQTRTTWGQTSKIK